MNKAPLVGLAVGDALGMPFEGSKQSDPSLLWWDGLFHAGEDHRLKPGQWTDDTQMSLVLSEAILEDPKNFDPIRIATRYAAWSHNEHPIGPARGIGKATRGALSRFRATGNISPDRESLGTGPVMRCTPILMAYHWQQAKGHLLTDGVITHGSPFIQNPLLVFGSFLSSLLMDQKMSLVVHQLANTLPGGAMQTIATAVDAAFACIVRTDSFAGAVQMAVRLGGDTDTVAALTGALAGAKYGLEGIPDQYLNGLESFDKILEINDKLMKVRDVDVLLEQGRRCAEAVSRSKDEDARATGTSHGFHGQ